MLSLFFILIFGYGALFYFFVLNFYWAIPIDLLIGLLLSSLTIVLIFMIGSKAVLLGKKDGKLKHKFYKSWANLILFFLNIHVKSYNKENIPASPFVICPNHKSYIDIIALYKTMNRPMTFISKPENFKIPFVKNYMRGIGCIPIDRNNDREAIKGIINGIKTVKSGMPVLIFPEGGIKSRTDEHMVNLRAGAYKLAMKPMVPVLPVSLLGFTKIKDNAPWKKTKCKVIIHPAISYEEYKEMNTHELGTKVMEIVNNEIDKNIQV